MVKSILFFDGSEIKEPAIKLPGYESTGDDKDGFRFYSNSFSLPVRKPIAKINLEMSYTSYPNYKKIILSREKPLFESDNGERYQLMSIDENKASLMITTPKDSEFAVEGQNCVGKTLFQSGQLSSFRSYSERAEPAMRDKNIDMKFTSMDIFFKGKPEKLLIYVADKPVKDKRLFQINSPDTKQSLFIAKDPDTGQIGFIDSSGKWHVKPEFSEVTPAEINGLYKAKLISSKNTEYYFVDINNSHPLKAPFDGLIRKLTPSLILVQKFTKMETSDGVDIRHVKYGVYDLLKHKFILNPEFNEIEMKDRFFIVNSYDSQHGSRIKYGAWTIDGKEIFPSVYEKINYKDGYLYTSSFNDRRDVYNSKGIKLNPDNYNVFGEFYQAQPVVLKDNTSGEYRLLNSNGEILSVKLKYDKVWGFSNGMAIVKKDNLEGAIDIYGRLAISLEYNNIEPFQRNLAAATLSDGTRRFVLIDRNNNVIKTYAGYNSIKVAYNRNDAVYHVYDGYMRDFFIDANGDIIK